MKKPIKQDKKKLSLSRKVQSSTPKPLENAQNLPWFKS